MRDTPHHGHHQPHEHQPYEHQSHEHRPYEHHSRHRPQHQQPSQPQSRGIPDGLLIALIVFLLGLTLLVWLATGLAAVFAHGAWPADVTVTHTPVAIRELAASPHDLAAAWPDTPPGQLSGYGLFWGLLISEVLVLVVLTVFVLGTVTRWRAVRTARRTAAARDRAGAAPQYGTDEGRYGEASAGPTGTPRVAPPRSPERSAPQPHTPQGNERAGQTSQLEQPEQLQQTGQSVRPDLLAEAAASPAAATPTPGATAAPAAPEPIAFPTPIAPVPAAAEALLPVPLVRFGPAAARRAAAVQAVSDAAGPALVVTSSPAVWSETKDARAKLGPVLVYDPGHLCDTPARLHWSPTSGCEDADTAAARAIALLSPVRPTARIDTTMAETAETLLCSWLHAAAVDGRPFRQVHRWAQGAGQAQEAVRILRTHARARSGSAGLLESALTAHPERREVAQELTARALSALSSVHIREACTPNRTDTVTLESFIHEGGTLYVVGEAIEDPRTHPGAMPLLTALASSVVEHGRRLAARSTDGRLDPPMTLVLDDVAAVAPLPYLPELLATGHEQGLHPLALLRSREQARNRWPYQELPDATPF
ncbi:type IV secretory system conjugative DNA transfer family protein [Streptomyces sp. NBC_01197]|uniref:type IV secretory system conjugative DNA transfer family protein n=1 Tax=Streptomyces sp. NBC_01197 TaxID=2903768 RepID=UPI002E137CAA|nr:type IV secretory system conjugative DNA transfer family protein [Streptomyces sp. NBC_01197]